MSVSKTEEQLLEILTRLVLNPIDREEPDLAKVFISENEQDAIMEAKDQIVKLMKSGGVKV